MAGIAHAFLPSRVRTLIAAAFRDRSEGASKKRYRIHHIYYLLAGLDLAAIAMGLLLTHYVNGTLSTTVHANLDWSRLHDQVAALRSGAGQVNEPGNDVFESKDASFELKRFDQAVDAFWPLLKLLRSDVARMVPVDAMLAPSLALNRLETGMASMVQQTRTLLSLYAGGQSDLAGAEMAAMDRSYSQVLGEIENAAHKLRQIENDLGLAALENTRRLRSLEILLGLLVVLIVVVVTIYGRKLGSLFQQHYDQLSHANAKLQEHEKLLQLKNVQLDAALNNMVQGLAMFDREQRLVVCNSRYASLYGLTEDQAQPGTTLRQIIEHRVAKGQVGEKSAEEVLHSMFSRIPFGEAGYYHTELSDGRHITVTAQPTRDGGAVTTHQDITEQRRSEAKIAHMALHDTLTGLPNRAQLNEKLEQAIVRVTRGELVATHLIDLDLFKNVNDSLGHPAGDKLLMLVADRLRAVVRDTDTIARMGGDEFAVVQVAIAGPADASSLAQRIVDAVGTPYSIDGHDVVIGVSVGIAIGPNDGLTHHDLMRNADLALYRAKAQGRGTFRFFEPEMDAQAQARRVLENDLRKALAAGEFELHYQPSMNIERGQVSGFEALIRWQHPQKGLIGPDAFIPLAEEIGLIVPLGEWVIREACSTASTWPGELSIAVNLSAVQFRSPGLVKVIFNALAASGLAPSRLELEVTETILLEDTETTLATLYSLRELGVRVAMDDFGTGYSSLSYLQSFPFDKIKIDRSFVRDITESAGSLNIVRAVAALAKGLGMTATAEGVETQEQLDTVALEGCTEMQGFLLSKPLPASGVEHLLETLQNGVKRAAVG